MTQKINKFEVITVTISFYCGLLLFETSICLYKVEQAQYKKIFSEKSRLFLTHHWWLNCQKKNCCQNDLFPPRIELGTFCVLGRRDNRYTTETYLDTNSKHI